jgi:hypothetical protein
MISLQKIGPGRDFFSQLVKARAGRRPPSCVECQPFIFREKKFRYNQTVLAM